MPDGTSEIGAGVWCCWGELGDMAGLRRVFVAGGLPSCVANGVCLLAAAEWSRDQKWSALPDGTSKGRGRGTAAGAKVEVCGRFEKESWKEAVVYILLISGATEASGARRGGNRHSLACAD